MERELARWRQAEDIFHFKLPPMAIWRRPRVGNPLPARQAAQVEFKGPLEIDTSIMKKTLARVLQAQHAGTQGNSRMGGRQLTAIYSVREEIELYKRRIRELEKEEAELKALFTALRARATASTLSPAVTALVPTAAQLGAETIANRARAEVVLEQHLEHSQAHHGALERSIDRLKDMAAGLEEKRAAERAGSAEGWAVGSAVGTRVGKPVGLCVQSLWTYS